MQLPHVSIIECSIGKFITFNNDALTKILLSDGVHEQSVLSISDFIINTSSSKHILDIGSNIGTFSIPLAKKYNDKKFFCFEIQKQIYYQLCGNISLNGINNISALNFGISSTDGFIEIPIINYKNCWNIGGYSIDKNVINTLRNDFPNESIVGYEKSNVKTLDSMIQDYTDIALIKLDIEGHEIEALKGGINFLIENGFPPIIFECWEFEWFSQNKIKLFNFFHNIGYNIISNDIGYNNYLAQNPYTKHYLYKLLDNVIYQLKK
jgi:FkbM family methyltransferase